MHFSNLVVLHLPACEDGKDSVPKRRHIKFRRRRITQKKPYNNVQENKYSNEFQFDYCKFGNKMK